MKVSVEYRIIYYGRIVQFTCKIQPTNFLKVKTKLKCTLSSCILHGVQLYRFLVLVKRLFKVFTDVWVEINKYDFKSVRFKCVYLCWYCLFCFTWFQFEHGHDFPIQRHFNFDLDFFLPSRLSFEWHIFWALLINVCLTSGKVPQVTPADKWLQLGKFHRQNCARVEVSILTST